MSKTSLLGPLTLALARIAIHMGNAPSVTGPDRGRTHVKRDMVNDDRSIELRPVNSSSSESDDEETNRKSTDEATQRSSFRQNGA